jgi:peptidylprolyl isomerase
MTKYVKTDKYFTITTKYGQTVIEFFPHKAPNHVKRIQELIEEGYYNGLKFHRVIDAFMAQTGCSKGDGTGGSNKPDLKAEFNDVKHEKGIVSMARKQDPHSANSQFFIMLGDAPYLDGQYTAFGQVVHGMDCIDRIKKGEGGNGMVINPDVIIEIQLGVPEDINV